MGAQRSIFLPAQFTLSGKILNNPIKQLYRPEISDEAEVHEFKSRMPAQLITRRDGTKTLIVTRNLIPPSGVDEVLLILDGDGLIEATEFRNQQTKLRWLKPKPISFVSNSLTERESYCEGIRNSWQEQFFFRQELYENGRIMQAGLRPPQLGALYATLAHWTVTNDPATIVMPTGTGKTETMVALLVDQQLERLLVVVPTAALREQISGKFLTLGVLKQFGVISSGALYPVVGILEHRLRTPDEVEAYFRCCNIIVTTMSIISGCHDNVQRKMAELCSHLFIDEAHHISAPTWEKFRRSFLQKTILQFTATPFRSDGKHVDGKIIFNYPLRKAQKEGYFKPINFLPIREYNFQRADEVMAKIAIQQLKRDLANGFNHILMARASDIKRATDVHAIYQRLATVHNPLLIHNEKSIAEKRSVIQQLRTGQSRIVVCVDMLGEGFDLPELKIAALHDIHKSLAVTLQFTGRFTRTKSNIGDASMIANIANSDVEESLRDLYAEDADWNFLLRNLSEGATGRQVRRSEFLDGFIDPPVEIPLQNVFPKMSTVVYRAKCANWRPEQIQAELKATQLYAGPTLNQQHKVLLFVTREREQVPWGNIKEIYNTIWDLYLLHWDADHKLLFINSSNNDSLHEELAKAVAGEDVELIRGEQIFRTLHGINRLILMNLGLNHSLSRAVRFTMYVGSDIREGLSEAHLRNKFKSNLFGRGFENGDKATIGCSYKGRIWSYKIAYDMSEWVDWCHAVGRKLLDETISVKDVFEHVIVPEQIQTRPALVPLTIEWSEEILLRNEDTIELDIGGEVIPFFEIGLELVQHNSEGPLQFRIFSETQSVKYEIKFRNNTVEYVPIDQEVIEIIISRKRRRLTEWFQKEPPVIRFENGAFLIYNELFKVPISNNSPFRAERIEAWDWTGTNLKKESQTVKKLSDSIQYRVIQELLRQDHDPYYDIVFDDDDAYEAADIVAIKVAGDRLIVHFFHCKYSSEETTGARVDDLYAVCGQAQRSVYWRGNIEGLTDHLRLREESRLQKQNASRFERGDFVRLSEIAHQAAFLIPEFKIFIVQPGLSKSKAETSQLELLAVTELYLQETYAIEFGVIANH